MASYLLMPVGGARAQVFMNKRYGNALSAVYRPHLPFSPLCQISSQSSTGPVGYCPKTTFLALSGAEKNSSCAAAGPGCRESGVVWSLFCVAYSKFCAMCVCVSECVGA
jgi:hypothetical protein